jgi:hypothetical protein
LEHTIAYPVAAICSDLQILARPRAPAGYQASRDGKVSAWRDHRVYYSKIEFSFMNRVLMVLQKRVPIFPV